MIVYYTSLTECPKSANGVKFFADHSTAMGYVTENRGGLGVYQFEVNDKCDCADFEIETMILLKVNSNGGLDFIISGNWVEIHDIMNVPFYVDFETRLPSYRIMSHSYFRKHFDIVERDFEDQVDETPVEPQPVEKQVSVDVSEAPVDVVEEAKPANNEIDDAVLTLFDSVPGGDPEMERLSSLLN